MTTIRRNWTEDETIIALVLYYQIPFGKITSTNPRIVEMAKKLGRTPAALSMKMCNLARFDETLQARHISGLANGSKLDKLVWDRYAHDYETLIRVFSQLQDKLAATPKTPPLPLLHDGHTVQRLVNSRVGQDFFRTAVLSAYDQTCCITGINVPEFLIASHIKPWAKSDDETEKVNPRNGLCLNALHDRAFDKGFITIDHNFRIIVSDTLHKRKGLDDTTRDWICSFAGREIMMPTRCHPDEKFLEYHHDVVFRG